MRGPRGIERLGGVVLLKADLSMRITASARLAAVLAAACAHPAAPAHTPLDGRATASTTQDGGVFATYEHVAAPLGPGRIALISFARSFIYRDRVQPLATFVCLPHDLDCSTADWFVDGSAVTPKARYDPAAHLSTCEFPIVRVFDLDHWASAREVEVVVCGKDRIVFLPQQIEEIRRVVAASSDSDKPYALDGLGLPAIK